MRVLFCGLGSIGLFHARLLRRHFGAHLFALRSRKGQGPDPPFPVEEVRSWGEVADLHPDAAFVTNPTNLHALTTIELMRRGARRIFLEKPIDSDLRRLGRLRSEALRTRAEIYVGYALRFHPVLRAMRKRLEGRRIFQVRMSCSSWLPDWRIGQDYRRSYSADGRRGGGVLLDLSHELDYLEFITGRRIAEITGDVGRTGRLKIRSEDRADLLIRLSDETPANVHLDFCSYQRERRVQVDWEGGYMEGDLAANRLTLRNSMSSESCQGLPCRREDLFVAQLRYFLRAKGSELRKDFERKTEMTERLLQFRNRTASSIARIDES